MEFFFDRTEQAKKPKVRHDLRSPNPNFRHVQVHQSFHFQKLQGPQISILFCENWHEASFYNKEQMQKYKFAI